MIYAISDIHGCYEKLMEKMNMVDLENNQIVFLGDYIDYGDSSFNLWMRNDIESGYRTFRTFVSSQELEEIDGIAQKADFDQTNVAAVKILLKKHGDLIRWIRKLPCYYETESSIFVHAGIDEDLGKDWSIGTSEDILLWKYPPTKGPFYKRIISGHVGTHDKNLSNDPGFHDVYYDGESHYYIDGSVYSKNGKLNMIAVDETDDTVYSVDDGKLHKIPAGCQ